MDNTNELPISRPRRRMQDEPAQETPTASGMSLPTRADMLDSMLQQRLGDRIGQMTIQALARETELAVLRQEAQQRDALVEALKAQIADLTKASGG